MNIREVEQQTGLKKANIRYYEQEGLIMPGRNENNNYRDYSDEDLKILERIKFLRILDISIQDIKKIQENKCSFSDIITSKMTQVELEIEQLNKIHEICKRIKSDNTTFENIDISVQDWNSLYFKKMGGRIMKLDRVEKMEQTVNNIRRLMCISTCVYPFAILGRDIIGHSLANALLFANVVIMAVTLSIWCWLNGRIAKYKKE